MRTKKVNRYWCDFCNKAGLQSRAMAVHEKHCTLNPARACRVCHLLEGSDGDHEDKKSLAELIAILPDSTAYNSLKPEDYYHQWETHRKLSEAITAVFPAFRKAAGDCPACMMAALRLAKIPVPMAEGFDYKKEMAKVFKHSNAMRNEDTDYSYDY